MSGSPIATVSNGVVTRMTSLPGGLALAGDTAYISSNGGTAALKLNSDGTRGSNQPQVYGPYGENVWNPAAVSSDQLAVGWHGQNALLDGTLISLGARAYRTDLGLFTSADPVQGGSQTMNDYAYVSGDPVNTSDLTGTMSQSGLALLANLASLAIQIPLMMGISSLMAAMPEGFASALGGSLRIATGVSIAAAATFAVNIGIIAGYNKNFSSITKDEWLSAGIMSVVSGLMGGAAAGQRAVETAAEAQASAADALGTADDGGAAVTPDPVNERLAQDPQEIVQVDEPAGLVTRANSVAGPGDDYRPPSQPSWTAGMEPTPQMQAATQGTLEDIFFYRGEWGGQGTLYGVNLQGINRSFAGFNWEQLEWIQDQHLSSDDD